ncbi:hypothetical protein [Streptomyces sp. SLBN-134]|uniref:hypothetical protein n=1 Tax=Streptomyces sp. SLBN-134 TaxID=2768456 RepID=UPI0011546930|nr:hypothetical protein [Streptomyces sp. SLBN-134]TQL23361.1 hypothetical protein FBY37_5422 [Streptomyces sp. SLBN-134]
MHAYDVPRRQSLASVPAPVRPAHDSRSGLSATPIYDALYTEYVASFRSLPGDRSGEEELGFVAFGDIPHSTAPHGGHSPGTFGASLLNGAYGAGGGRQGAGPQPQWQRVSTAGRPASGMRHVPAGLPPAPRRGA